MALSGKQKRSLRALGHHLSVVVQVGAEGVTAGVIAAVAQALNDHELVKVKIADEKEGRTSAVDEIAKATDSEVAQIMGRTALFFKQRSKNPKIKLDAKAKVKAKAKATKPSSD
jgi:RNA-binding protein